MLKQNKHFLRIVTRTAVLIFAAVFCRRLALATDVVFVGKLANSIRIFLYIGLFSTWGVSVSHRVMQPQIRRYLVVVAGLMVVWLFMRELRWHYVKDPDILRILWYSYHIYTLFIPLLALLVSLSLGKPETYRLPKQSLFLYLPTVGLILLVLTNDLHQFVFRFPADAAVWSDSRYHYGAGFVLITAWGVLCAMAAFFVMLTKCRLPQIKKFLWLPLIPFAAAVLYMILYALRVPFVVHLLGDLAVSSCLMFTAFFESCIQCGLIPSNTRYFDLFRASKDISAQITDMEYVVRYAASGAVSIPKEEMLRAEHTPLLLPSGKQLHNMPVNGGHAIWIEDMSELLSLRETLEEQQDELQVRNALLKLEYEREKQHRTVAEKNRLYDLIQSKTQAQLDQIKFLMERCRAAETEAEKRRILSYIIVLGSYIKRREDFVLSMNEVPLLAKSRLESAFQESFRSLRLLGIQGSYLVHTSEEYLSGNLLARAYDFFEDVLEMLMDMANYLNVRVGEACGGLRVSILTDFCVADDFVLMERYPDMRIVREDDGTEFILPLV